MESLVSGAFAVDHFGWIRSAIGTLLSMPETPDRRVVHTAGGKQASIQNRAVMSV
jgi:hypothetical protein